MNAENTKKVAKNSQVLIDLLEKAKEEIIRLTQTDIQKKTGQLIVYSFNLKELQDLQQKFIEPILKMINNNDDLLSCLEEYLEFRQENTYGNAFLKLEKISNTINKIKNINNNKQIVDVNKNLSQRLRALFNVDVISKAPAKGLEEQGGEYIVDTTNTKQHTDIGNIIIRFKTSIKNKKPRTLEYFILGGQNKDLENNKNLKQRVKDLNRRLNILIKHLAPEGMQLKKNGKPFDILSLSWPDGKVDIDSMLMFISLLEVMQYKIKNPKESEKRKTGKHRKDIEEILSKVGVTREEILNFLIEHNLGTSYETEPEIKEEKIISSDNSHKNSESLKRPRPEIEEKKEEEEKLDEDKEEFKGVDEEEHWMKEESPSVPYNNSDEEEHWMNGESRINDSPLYGIQHDNVDKFIAE